MADIPGPATYAPLLIGATGTLGAIAGVNAIGVTGGATAGAPCIAEGEAALGETTTVGAGAAETVAPGVSVLARALR